MFLLSDEEFKLQPPSEMCLFTQRFEVFCDLAGNIVPSLLTATSLQWTSGGRTRFNLVPRAFP